MNDKTKEVMEKVQIKDDLKQEFESMLEQRVKRYLELRPHGIIPNSHFAAVSAECYFLYRDGHYYGTISLVQAVAEALVRFLCKINGWGPNNNFEKNLKQLTARGKLTNELATSFREIWKDRDDYHHLNFKIEQDRQKLELLAKNKLACLKHIEKALFAYSTIKGNFIPQYPKYWDQKQNTIQAFLRLD